MFFGLARAHREKLLVFPVKLPVCKAQYKEMIRTYRMRICCMTRFANRLGD